MGSKAFDDAIRESFARAGVALDDAPRARLATYCSLLERWNRRIRLVGTVEPGAVAERHVLDCSLAAIDPAEGETLLDAGTGAGLPGIVVAILRPGVQVTMIERVAKKVAFVRAAIDELGLMNAHVLRVDLADVVDRSFDRAISRALMPPENWLAAGARVVRDGGAVGAMVARLEELSTAVGEGAGAKLSLEVVREVTLPSDRAQRLLAWFRVSRPT